MTFPMLSHLSVRTRTFVVCALVAAAGAFGAYSWALPGDSSILRVVFFDVGQGDAIFVETPSGIQILIDGGPDRSVLRALTREMGFFDRSLDMVVLTHEDADHVGGLPDVFERYHVGSILRTEYEGESGAADRIDDAVEKEGSVRVYARSTMLFDLGDKIVLEVLFPDRDPRDLEGNTSSIVARLSYGETSFLFTGDAPRAVETFLVSSFGPSLQSDVLKLGHHGSRTSTAEEFLDAVMPQMAVVSAGAHNRYGHPHRDVLETLERRKIPHAATSDGAVVFESDGVQVLRRR